MTKKELTKVDAALAAVRKKYGDGVINTVTGAVAEAQHVRVIPTGSRSLDKALGVRGWPRGRVVEVFGFEASGKTTLALHAVAECQRAGLVAAFVDAEHALDVRYAAALGVDLSALLLSQPDDGEQALQVVEALAGTDGVGLVVVDSVAALVPRAELDGETGDAHMGLQARLMSQHLRKLCGRTYKGGVCVMFLNQQRQKLGVVFGNPNTTTGGNALRYYASVRVYTSRKDAVKTRVGGEVAQVGNTHVLKVQKNKLAPPFTEASVNVLWGRGFDRAAELRDAALEAGVLVQNGSWFYKDAERLCQGSQTLRQQLEDDAELRGCVEAALDKKEGRGA